MGERFGVWPRRRSTALVLAALIALQAALFVAATGRSFFTHEDNYNFALTRDRSFLAYLATPIIHTYPEPGHRLLFYLADRLFPMNYAAARAVLLVLLALTTVLLGQLVRTLARSDEWWTVALVTPFALSLTLVSPINLWSNGVPVLPLLLCTVIALLAWIRSYTGPNERLWAGVAIVAMAIGGTFYLKFLLIALYFLLFRLAILPAFIDLPRGVRGLWRERIRWAAVAAPPALFLAGYWLSGLAARSYVPGHRPYLEYVLTAWARAFVPVSFLNVPLGGGPLSTPALVALVLAHGILALLVLATWKRSAFAWRGWVLFAIVFVANVAMVGAARLPGFGIEIAYWLRYYPEIVLFLPIVLAFGLRQGGERAPSAAWERTRSGQLALGAFACVYIVGFALHAPGIVRASDGARARVWFDNLRRDLDRARAGQQPLRIVDAETPDYIVLSWMEPYNRVSTILGLLRVDAIYNDASGSLYVRDDGSLGTAAFRPIRQLWPGDAAPQVEPVSQRSACLPARGLEYRPEGPLRARHLAVRVRYARSPQSTVMVYADTGDPDRPSRTLELYPAHGRAELLDLGTSTVRAVRIRPSDGDVLCVDRLEIGSVEGK